MKHTQECKKLSPFRIAAALFIVVSSMPMLAANAQTTVAKTQPNAVSPEQNAAKPPVRIHEQLISLRDAAQSALQRAEDDAKDASATTVYPRPNVVKPGKAQPKTVLENLRDARDATQAALDVLEKAAWERAKKRSPRGDWTKTTPDQKKTIIALELQIEALDKELAVSRQQFEKFDYEAYKKESARQQQRYLELSRQTESLLKSSEQTRQRAEEILRMSEPKP